MEAAYECVMTRRVATGASGSWPHHINDLGAQVRTIPASSGGGWEFGGDQRLVAELAEGVVGLAGQLAGHRQRGPLATQALFDLEVIGVVGEDGRAAHMAASCNAQPSTGEPWPARWPRARLPSDSVMVMSRPQKRTAWRLLAKRRTSPNSAQIATAVSQPIP